jgi:epoxyqueuosine reductase
LNAKDIQKAFLNYFDVVGIIETKKYLDAAKHMDKEVPHVDYQTMVVLGLSYPNRMIKHTKTHLVPSFYTFGSDYHKVLKERIEQVTKDLSCKYQYGVDNHPHNERLAAVLSGVGYFGKNQLIINKELGTYMFLGIVFLDITIDHEIVLEITDDCGTCRKCITACPTHALSDIGFDFNKCMSHYNQTKKVLSDQEIESNYLLFGCDICQMVCPKNIYIKPVMHEEFELSGKEMVSIVDLFSDSERVFKEKYHDMSYLWKGKTILMRNALTLLLKQKNTDYNELIRKSIKEKEVPWYQETAIHILSKLDKIKK